MLKPRHDKVEPMPARHHSPLLKTGLLLVGLIASSEPAMGDENRLAGEAMASELPIFDAHVHYKEPAWDTYPPDVILSMMDRNGVAMALVSSTPDEGTIRLWHYAPGRIVPEIRPYNDRWGAANWISGGDAVADYLEERLRQYSHEGIGEFHLHRVDLANDSLLKRIIALARARDIPLHVHAGHMPIRHLYSLDPDITIIWAHAGMSEPPEVIAEMMETHGSLYADTSFREMDILDHGRGGISRQWQQLLERFSDRFMVGSDTWVNSQWARYDQLIDMNRRWLAQLTPDTARKIAYQNAERLFGKKISRDLLGTH